MSYVAILQDEEALWDAALCACCGQPHISKGWLVPIGTIAFLGVIAIPVLGKYWSF